MLFNSEIIKFVKAYIFKVSVTREVNILDNSKLFLAEIEISILSRAN